MPLWLACSYSLKVLDSRSSNVYQEIAQASGTEHTPWEILTILYKRRIMLRDDAMSADLSPEARVPDGTRRQVTASLLLRLILFRALSLTDGVSSPLT